jgi:hypothetical protein
MARDITYCVRNCYHYKCIRNTIHLRPEDIVSMASFDDCTDYVDKKDLEDMKSAINNLLERDVFNA